MERAMRLSESVIRYMTLVVDETAEDEELSDTVGASQAPSQAPAGA